MKAKNIKVIFDTNVWICYLIGKRLSFITNDVAGIKTFYQNSAVPCKRCKKVGSGEVD